MKGKVKRGMDFDGVLKYALDDEKDAEIIGGNMAGTNANDLAAEFAVSQQMRPGIKKPVLHIALSLPIGDSVTPEKWNLISRSLLKKMGLGDKRQWVAIIHRDADHQHIHIITSRIDLTGGLWLGKFEAMKLINATQEIEREHGLRQTKGLDSVDPSTHKASAKKEEIEKSIRTGEAPPRLRLQQIIDTAIGDRVTIFGFIERLEAAGVRAIPSVATTGKMNGFAFELDGIPFKGSQLGKSYSWAQLQQRGVEYEQDRDGEQLIAAADRIKQTSRGLNSREPAADAAGGTGGIGGRGVDSERSGATQPDHGGGHRADHSGDGRNAGGGELVDQQAREFTGGDSSRHDGNGENSPARADEAHIWTDQGAGSSSHEGQHSGAGRRVTDKIHDMEAAMRNLADQRDPWNDLAVTVGDLAASVATDGDKPIQSGTREIAPDVQKKIDAWNRQNEAIGAPKYRITIVPRTSNGKQTFVLGDKEGIPAKEVVNFMGELRANNARGNDIYITPIDDRNHYILVDDVKTRNLEAIKISGYKPCLIQKTSHDNHQLVIKVPRENRSDEQEIANELTMKLNRQFGDKNLSGAVHPFRMAGFSNKKPERKNHLTLILDAANRVCDVAKNMLAGLRRQYDEMAIRGEQERRTRWIEQQSNNTGDIQAEFRLAYKKHLALAAKLGWEQNGSALDWQVVLELIEKKYSASDIKRTLIECSPNVIARHSNVDEYADRTITKAMSEHRKAEPAAPAERAKRVQRDRDDGQSYGR